MKPRSKKVPASSVRIGRWRDVEAMTGLGHSSIYRALAADAGFPRPFQLIPGGRSVGWNMAEVERWAAARIAKGNAESWEASPRRAAARKARSTTRGKARG